MKTPVDSGTPKSIPGGTAEVTAVTTPASPALAAPAAPVPSDFLRDIVAAHVAGAKYPQIHTRFPPEPNGYLRIGHAKSICLDFGIAVEYGGVCNLRYDDTNPTKEEVEYVDSIFEDVTWLIGGWADRCLGLKPKGKTPERRTVNGKEDFYLPAAMNTADATPKVGQASLLSPSDSNQKEGRRDACPTLEPFYASDYFAQLYEYAVALIQKGKAYVCDLSPEDTDQYRGAPDRPGKDSPFRDRSVAENLDWFSRMKAGEFP